MYSFNFSLIFQVIGVKSCNLLASALRTLAELRETPEFTAVAEVDEVFGGTLVIIPYIPNLPVAIEYGGAASFLDIIPLNLEKSLTSKNEDCPNRSWLLPILRSSIKNCPIALFAEHFEPMYKKLQKQAGC